ncbi:uncharacterized protein BX663DRAFT_561797 [Cokeromyces recurvatus]|uniref:uncharacterized protein n=1 Tax=Cokeromyces recurvatus TaxID=90255 RepID=UPI00221E47A7|nr:uncharacterized protein BX663DRAFT_561797 [Cokeromyces recurvatus]KAI7902232.1 hypothetical protein BX663DRAFT_561797 [Cokeromyces recurvatus]
MKEAYVTLVATDSYAAGALVLFHKLSELGSKKDQVCLITPNISLCVQDTLKKVCTQVIMVDLLRSTDKKNLELLGRPELDITFTKIHLWRLTQYSKLVFLDADCFPLKSDVDKLFDHPSFSAAPDAGWPDCFNSGVFVTVPSEKIYQDLIQLASENGSFDGGDQGLLNTYFSTWCNLPSHRLPFTFNTTPTAQYGYAPAHNQFGRNISIFHFIGENKPWKYQRFADGKVLPLGNTWEGIKEMVQEWWNTWDKFYGRISPYHLLSGKFIEEFDDGFQTCPIVPFDENVKNAWENQNIKVYDERRQTKPMPPISHITIGQPDWLKEELLRSEQQKKQEEERKREEERQKREQAEKEERQRREQAEKEQRQRQEREEHDRLQKEQHTQEDVPNKNNHYSMIEWDPAHQEPPKTGKLSANIPDLSNYTNVWDQPLDVQQSHTWVAPVHHPEPEILSKPEYSNYHPDDYAPDAHYSPIHTNYPSHQQEYPQEQHHHYQEEHHEEEHYQEQYYQEQHHQEEHHQEEHHQEEHQSEFHQEENHQKEHYQEEHRQEEQHHEEPIYYSSFPWESNPDHFPPPSRIWLDEQPHHEPEHHHEPEQHHEPEHHHHEPEHHHHEPEHHHYESKSNEEQYIVESNSIPQEENNQTESVRQPEMENQIRELQISHQEEQYPLVTESKHILEEDPNLFAIDKLMSPSAQTKIEEFIASLIEEEQDDNDISDRDLIPINFKPTSRLHTGMYTPSPGSSRQGSRSNSRRTSVSSSRRNSVYYSSNKSTQPAEALSPETPINRTYPILPENEQPIQQSNMFASADSSSSMYNRKTPYTSAAVTPVARVSPEERDDYSQYDYFGSDLTTTSNPDFLYNHQYSLADSLAALESSLTKEEWDPERALTELKEHSEGMVLRQSLKDALATSSHPLEDKKGVQKDDDDMDAIDLLPPPAAAAATAQQAKKEGQKSSSSWDEEEVCESPNAPISDESSPRTPLIRSMSNSDLSKEIAIEKERYRQQRASLMLAQPQAAVASMLEAELDLSRGTLFKRRYYDDIIVDPDLAVDEKDSLLVEPTSTINASLVKKPTELTASKVAMSGDDEDKEEEEDILFVPPIDQNIAFYDDCVIRESQRRLRALVIGENDDSELSSLDITMPLPIATGTHHTQLNVSKQPLHMYQRDETKNDPQPFGLSWNSRAYESNFGFDEKHKLHIYRPELVLSQDAAAEIQSFNPEIELVKTEDPITKRKNRLAAAKKMKEEQQEEEDPTVVCCKEKAPEQSAMTEKKEEKDPNVVYCKEKAPEQSAVKEEQQEEKDPNVVCCKEKAPEQSAMTEKKEEEEPQKKIKNTSDLLA